MADDQDNPDPTHIPGTRQGNEVGLDKKEGKEAGREKAGTSGADRPAGTSTTRDSTGVNPQDPIDPEMPDFPSP
ncbi:MAG: hypothetical protein ACR2MY_06310 [Candidatus Dormibacteria bacterium]